MCADFRELTPLEKVQRFIKDNKETWLDGFQTIDDAGVFRVPIPDFFDVLQVLLLQRNLSKADTIGVRGLCPLIRGVSLFECRLIREFMACSFRCKLPPKSL